MRCIWINPQILIGVEPGTPIIFVIDYQLSGWHLQIVIFSIFFMHNKFLIKLFLNIFVVSIGNLFVYVDINIFTTLVLHFFDKFLILILHYKLNLPIWIWFNQWML